MEGFTLWINAENIEVVHSYLFGGVKFLDLLVLLMAVDIVTGIMRAIKEKRLRSRKAMYGYARKVGVFALIIVANIVDTVLGLSGLVAFGTVMFYILNEILSIVENLSQIGMKIPAVITDKLHVLQEENKESAAVPIVTENVNIITEEKN
ncbi:holin [Bacillus idriensis]|uniref:Holin n=1 Tax=Metabacillus idriensis TaxID=324768 RepID=A0A6I2M939_9BACI|nr:phage holin family protein [Metabacillus idriensis]MRX54855.1 holin [Metabacillus idriensis]